MKTSEKANTEKENAEKQMIWSRLMKNKKSSTKHKSYYRNS